MNIYNERFISAHKKLVKRGNVIYWIVLGIAAWIPWICVATMTFIACGLMMLFGYSGSESFSLLMKLDRESRHNLTGAHIQ